MNKFSLVLKISALKVYNDSILWIRTFPLMAKNYVLQENTNIQLFKYKFPLMLILASFKNESTQWWWASLLCIIPPKRYYHLRILNLPGLQNLVGIVSRISCWVFEDLVVFDSQNKLEKNSFIGVQGDCLYILFPSFSKLI